MFSRVITPKEEDKNSKTKIITIKDISKKILLVWNIYFFEFSLRKLCLFFHCK